MKRFARAQSWIRWFLVAAATGVCLTSSCGVGDAMRELADGISQAADDLDGKKPSDWDRFVEGINTMFDDD